MWWVVNLGNIKTRHKIYEEGSHEMEAPMRQRVSIIEGRKPIIIIAPYGANHKNTDTLVELLAKRTNSFGIINWGWQRSPVVDFKKDLADCGHISQLHQNILYDEFLDPIIRFKNRISRFHQIIHMFIITGHIGNSAPGGVDIVVGYGKNASYTCEEWRKNLLMYLAHKESITMYEAKSTSFLSAVQKNHINQLFRSWYPDHHVQSMQLDIASELTKTKDDVEILVEFLGSVMLKYHILPKQKAKAIVPDDFKIRVLNQ